MNLTLGNGNRKLSKNYLIFNLPALTTCPGSGDCKKWCYARKAERLYPMAVSSRQRNLLASKSNDFVKKMVGRLNESNRPYVRIHESGDFYSQKYLDKWKDIARQCPTKVFNTSTKSMHLDLYTNMPSNMILKQSYSSKYDQAIKPQYGTIRVVSNHTEATNGEVLCPSYKYDYKTLGCGDKCKICLEDKRVKLVIVKH